MKHFIEDFLSHQWALLVCVVLVSFFIICGVAINAHHKWDDNVHNPANAEYVVEVAFNLGIHVDSVTQEQFNARYLSK